MTAALPLFRDNHRIFQTQEAPHSPVPTIGHFLRYSRKQRIKKERFSKSDTEAVYVSETEVLQFLAGLSDEECYEIIAMTISARLGKDG